MFMNLVEEDRIVASKKFILEEDPIVAGKSVLEEGCLNPGNEARWDEVL